MKHSFPSQLILFMALFFVSCSKKQNETSESISSAPKIKLMGEWTWVESRTGWEGSCYTSYRFNSKVEIN